MSEEFRKYVADRGENVETLTNEEKRKWAENFDSFLLRQQQTTGRLHSTAFFPLFLS